MTWAALAVTAASTIFSSVATASSDNYNAQVARNNAITEQQNAQYAREAGAAQTQAAGLKGAAQGGAIKAGLAANGVDVNSGSALDVESGQREESELNEQTTMNNAELKAYGYDTQATSDEAQSKLDESEAIEAPIGGVLKAMGVGLSGVSNTGLLGGANPTGGASGGWAQSNDINQIGAG